MNGWKSLPVALHLRFATSTVLCGVRQPAAFGSLEAVAVPFSVLLITRTVLIGKASVKFGSAKQLVSRNEAPAGKMIYTITM